MSKTESFYTTGSGERLIDPHTYPSEVKAYLEKELELLWSRRKAFDLIVEIGCMHGLHLDWAFSSGKKYLGIDPVKRYIQRGRYRVTHGQMSRSNFSFIKGNSENLALLINPEQFNVARNRTLLFFPFNSIGNMDDPKPVILAIARSRMPFLISTYDTADEANNIRFEYYRSGGYKMLRMSRSHAGIRFTSRDGLSSMAYHPSHLIRLFVRSNLECQVEHFSNLGVAYYG